MASFCNLALTTLNKHTTVDILAMQHSALLAQFVVFH